MLDGMALDQPITRRVFLRQGALLSAAIASFPSIPMLLGPGQAEAAIMGIGKELQANLNEETINQILEEALARGGDFADVFAEQRYRTSIVLDDGRIDSVSYGYPRGASVRVFHRRRTGFACTEQIDYNPLLDAARVASTVVKNQSRVTPVKVVPRDFRQPFEVLSPVAFEAEEVKFDLIRRMDAAARAVDPRIVSVRVDFRDEVRDILIGTSDGVYATERQYLVSIQCTPTAVEGSSRRSGLATLGGRVGMDYFQRYSVEDAARAAARQAVTMLGAGPAPAGPMPVVIGPGWGGVLVHESIGHALEGDAVRRGTSILAGKLGAEVASPLVRVVDDGRHPYARGSTGMDDEGTASQRTVCIEGGRLRSYLLDRLNAGLMGLQSTGNGRRNSYRNWPIPRMTNIYIDAGTSDPPSLLSGITKGLYAAQMGGGSVDTTSGNFNFAVREGYLIENGKVTRPVQGAILVGNSVETMKRIEGVGRDLLVDTTRGTCGKDGQWVPVGVGQPTVRFSSVTVGGTAI